MLKENDYPILWQQVLSSIRSEINQTSYETWFVNSGVDYQKKVGGTVYILVNGNIAINWITRTYLKQLEEKFSALAQEPVHIELVDKNLLKNGKDSHESAVLSPANIQSSNNLNSRYTFETFVVGASNRLPHAASIAVAESPAEAYNPLFIYGGVGLGKTHLLHAIGHRVLEKNPAAIVRYVSCEQFTNELIAAIQNSQTQAFRNRYRNCDVLMVDDIQFLTGKEQTQQEFFHTFNTLYEAHKQVVISSDRQPREIPTLEDRLRSRFEWGLIADIKEPDLETRIAILMKKVETDQLNVPYDVLTFIGTNIKSNIRELEGALTRLVAYSNFNEVPINMETTKEALRDILPHTEYRPITITLIQEEVSRYFKISKEELISKQRSKYLVVPRHIAMYLCSRMTGSTLSIIGKAFNRDHTTVMNGIGNIEKELPSNPETQKIIGDLYAIIDPSAKPIF